MLPLVLALVLTFVLKPMLTPAVTSVNTSVTLVEHDREKELSEGRCIVQNLYPSSHVR